ncbi:MAG: hypothetical protein EXR08_01435 [Alphaproteobacteria bacterium]|nr:hypothetical protein [Alphaproteobacteria bacterium]
MYRTSEDGKHTYEEIEPLNNLAAKAGITKATKVPKEILERAKAIVENISEEFPQYVQEEIERMRVMAKALSSAGTSEEASEAVEDIKFAAHDFKGQGGSFGYPLLSRISASLYHLLKQASDFGAPIQTAVKVHIDSIALVNSLKMKDPEHPEGKRLVAEVEALTRRLVGPLTEE